MNHEEQNQISAGLSEIVERLQSLKDQPTSPAPPWPRIQAWIAEAHLFFNEVLDAFKLPCERYLEQLKSDSREFEHWQFNLADLWTRLDFLRGVHNRAFCHDYSAIIYHHIFIEEMFECLPRTLGGAKTKFLLLPSGDLVVWPMKAAFRELAPSWFDEDALKLFDEFENKDTIVCFECHRDRNFERQAVLAHEIIHILVRNNTVISQALHDAADDPKIADSLNASRTEARSQVEELFCDFAAAWFYGPVYLQAFAEEISHFPVWKSETHPASDLRAKFLLEGHKHFNDHRGFEVLSQYFKLRKRHSLPALRWFRDLAGRFENVLLKANLQRYSHFDQATEIVRSFQHNIPAVVKDIRTFINNLPPRRADEDTKRHAELVSESLRKTNLLRQIKNYMREPDALFSMPAALSRPARLKRKKR